MPELRFVKKQFISGLSVDEIKMAVHHLEEPYILEKSTSDAGFKIVTKANQNYSCAYGLIFNGELEVKTERTTLVTITMKTRHDFFWINFIFISLMLATFFNVIQVNGESQDLTDRLNYTLFWGLLGLGLNVLMILIPVSRLNNKLIDILKGR